MGTRSLAIMGYGTEEDRAKVAALAKLSEQSVSAYLLDTIRANYKAVFGDAPPPSNPENVDVRKPR